MQSVSNEFKELAKSNARISLAKFIIKDSNTEIDGETIIDGFIEEMTCDNTSLVGNVMAKNIETSIYNNFTNDFIGKEIYAYTGQQLEDETEEYVPRGTFIIDEIEEDISSGALKLKGLDYTIKFNKAWEDPLDWENNTYTLGDFAKAVCEFCGLELETEEFSNSDYVLTQQPAFQGYQCRYVMQRIAEIATSNVFISPEDKVQIRLAPQNYVSAEGSSIALEESANSRLKIDEFDGEITQEITNGYQLLKNTNVNSGDNNYWQSYSTFDQENRELTRSTTGTTEVFIAHRLSGLESGVAYTLSFYAKSNGYVKRPEWYIYNQSTQGIKHDYFDVTTTYQKYTVTFTTVSDVTYGANSNLRFDNNGSTTSGTEAILYIKDVMLEKGSTAHDYEGFTNGVSPNPDYPQDIEITTGRQKVDLKGLNLFDMNNYKVFSNVTGNFMSYGNGIISIVPTRMDFVSNTPPMTTTPTDSQKITIKTYSVKVSENTQYTLTYDNPNLCQNQILVFEYDDSCSYIKHTSSTFNSDEKFVYNFTTTSTTKYLMFRFDNEDYNTGAKQLSIQNMMIIKGNYSSANLPIYKDYKYEEKEINLGKNLLQLTNGSYSNNGITALVENGKITLNGTCTNSTSFILIPSNLSTLDGTYTISANNTSTVGSSSNSTDIRIYKDSSNSFATFLYTQDSYHTYTINNISGLTFRIRTGVGLTYDNFVIYPQLEKGSTKTSYSPYFTPIELGKIGDYKDFIFKGKGKNLLPTGVPFWGGTNQWYDLYGNVMGTLAQIQASSNYIILQPNTTYKLFAHEYNNIATMQLIYIDSDNTIKTYVNSTVLTGVATFTTTEYTKVWLRVKATASVGNTYFIGQLEKGNSSTTYEPYNAKGKWYLHKEIGKVVFNGSENWIKHGSIASWFYYDGITDGYINNTSANIGKCNYFKQREYNAVVSLVNGEFAYGSPTGETTKRLVMKNTDYTMTADFKNWLSTHNTIVYYVLANSTNTEITSSNYPELYSQLKAIEKIRSFDGITYIDVDSVNLPFDLSLQYDQKVSEDIDINSIMSLEVEDTSYKPYNAVTLALADGIEGENVTLRDESSIALYGERALVITANEFAINQAVREELIEEMFNSINGFNYVPMKLEYNSYDWLERYDRIKVQYDENNYYETYLFNHTTEFPATIKSVIEDVAISENKVKYEFVPETQQKNVHTEIVVDKLNGTISEVVSTQEEFQDSLSQLSVTVDGIQSKVELNYDFVRETSGNNYVSVDDIQQEGLLELKITGTAISSGNLILHITNNVPEYIELPISTILKQGNVADELSIEAIYNEDTELYELHCFIDKKLDYIENQIVTRSSTNNFLLNQDSTKLTTESSEDLLLDDYVEGKENLGIISIPIQEGQHTFSIENFNNLSYYLKYAVLNNITSEFALKKHIVSEINQSAEQIQISADKVSLTGKTIEMTSDNISINSDNFKVDEEGKVLCDDLTVTGGNINILSTEDQPQLILMDAEKLVDANLINEISCSGITVSGEDVYPYILLQTFGGSEGIPRSGQLKLYSGGEQDFSIQLDGELGDITCVSLTQTSLEEKKKNFEKLVNALDIVKDVDIYKYNFKNEDDEAKKHIGFVIGDKFKYKEEITSKNNNGADVYAMTSVLWRAVQEQQEQIEKMQKEIEILKGGQ